MALLCVHSSFLDTVGVTIPGVIELIQTKERLLI